MNWILKSMIQSVFSAIPLGEKLNYFGQQYVFRMLPMDDGEFQKKIGLAKEHLQAVRKYLLSDIKETIFFEFGVGVDMSVPLTFYSLGVKQQIVTDVRKLARKALVLNTMNRLNINHSNLSDCGIKYIAPFNCYSTGFKECYIDVITSTSVLEHIEPIAMQTILKECYRILKPGGVVSFLIDYRDHYSYLDPHISTYNYLRYSDRAWSFVNPSLHYQNRLRHCDYLKLFVEAGFRIAEDSRHLDPADIDYLRKLTVASRFKKYSLDELAIQESHVVLVK